MSDSKWRFIRLNGDVYLRMVGQWTALVVVCSVFVQLISLMK